LFDVPARLHGVNTLFTFQQSGHGKMSIGPLDLGALGTGALIFHQASGFALDVASLRTIHQLDHSIKLVEVLG